MLLGIGMAVDANVICFERVKENLLIGLQFYQKQLIKIMKLLWELFQKIQLI